MAESYFRKAQELYPEDKAVGLMIERCVEFIENPPSNWDGGFEFHTK